MEKTTKKIYDWAAQKANTSWAPFWLGLIFFLEMVLILPLDAILVLFCLENPRRQFLYAIIAAVMSTIGGIGGYLLGLFAWDVVSPYVLGHVITPDFFDRLCSHYLLYQNWAVFIGSFLPVPFKAITLSAGVCKIALIPFISVVFLARWTRFFLIAKATQRWGEKIKTFVGRHLNRIALAIGAKIAVAFAFFWALGQL